MSTKLKYLSDFKKKEITPGLDRQWVPSKNSMGAESGGNIGHKKGSYAKKVPKSRIADGQKSDPLK